MIMTSKGAILVEQGVFGYDTMRSGSFWAKKWCALDLISTFTQRWRWEVNLFMGSTASMMLVMSTTIASPSTATAVTSKCCPFDKAFPVERHCSRRWALRWISSRRSGVEKGNEVCWIMAVSKRFYFDVCRSLYLGSRTVQKNVHKQL